MLTIPAPGTSANGERVGQQATKPPKPSHERYSAGGSATRAQASRQATRVRRRGGEPTRAASGCRRISEMRAGACSFRVLRHRLIYRVMHYARNSRIVGLSYINWMRSALDVVRVQCFFKTDRQDRNPSEARVRDKGKPGESRRRKATRLKRPLVAMPVGPPNEPLGGKSYA